MIERDPFFSLLSQCHVSKASATHHICVNDTFTKSATVEFLPQCIPATRDEKRDEVTTVKVKFNLDYAFSFKGILVKYKFLNG